MRLSRLRHDDVQPRAQLAQGGSIPPRRAGNARIDDDPGTGRHRAVGSRLDDAAGGLVPQHEGKGPDRGEGGGGPRVVGEEMEVAAADPSRQHLDAGPRGSRELRFRQLGQRGGEGGVDHVEHDGAHAVSVGASVDGAHGGRRSPGALRVHGGHGVRLRIRCRAMRVSDATLDEVRVARLLDHGGLPGPGRAVGGAGGAVAALPPVRGVLRRSRRPRALRDEPVRRCRGVPLSLLGPEPAGRAPGSGGRGRALPRDRRAAPLQGRVVGEVLGCGELRPAAPSRLRQPQPRRAAAGGALPTAHYLRLPLRRHGGGRSRRGSCPTRTARTSRTRRCTSPSDRSPTARCRAPDRRGHCCSTGPTSCTAVRT